MRILADASLPGLDSAFPSPFILSRYSNAAELSYLLEKQDILLCRATLNVNSALLKNHHLQYVATASSGTNHLDHVYLKSQGIQIIDAKGANAPSVADYVVSCIANLDLRRLISGKKAGIIGLGEVGKKVNKRLQAAGFQVINYDPLKAQNEPMFESCSLENLLDMDLLCIHAELHEQSPYPSLNLIDKAFLEALKPGCVIINAARGGIVNEEALLTVNRPLLYCTDVYLNEPTIDKRIIDKATLCTPHIAGHSVEAKLAAVTMVSEKLHQLFGLAIPQFPSSENTQEFKWAKDTSWQELTLTFYNPEAETVQLKQAEDIASTFLCLRKSHQKRHNFSVYSESIKDQKTRLLFGINDPQI
jgi:erythronate-4-phosphate dehydrogenase